MNNARRKRIQEVVKSLEEIRDQIEALRNDVEDIKDEEQECFDNLPEGLQGSERGQAMETNAETLDETVANLEDIDFEDIITALENIE